MLERVLKVAAASIRVLFRAGARDIEEPQMVGRVAALAVGRAEVVREGLLRVLPGDLPFLVDPAEREERILRAELPGPLELPDAALRILLRTFPSILIIPMV